MPWGNGIPLCGNAMGRSGVARGSPQWEATQAQKREGHGDVMTAPTTCQGQSAIRRRGVEDEQANEFDDGATGG